MQIDISGWMMRFVGRRIYYLKSVGSTNDFAKSLITKEGHEVDGSLVIADEQTKGKGRLKRVWVSPRGGAYLSLILKQKNTENVSLLSVLSALPVARALGKYGLECAVKWPNDLIVGPKKIGGILGELVTRGENHFAIVGIGINSNMDVSGFPKELEDSATSIKNELGTDISNTELIERIMKEYKSFYGTYSRGEHKRLLEEYKELSAILGKHVVVKSTDETIKGRALDISEDGALIIKVGTIEKKVLEGDVFECRVVA